MHKKRLWPLLILIMLLPVGAMAAASGSVSLYVTQADATSMNQVNRVKSWYESSPKTRYLFLPSGWDCSALKVWISSGNSLKIDGTSLKNGDITNLLKPGKTVTITYASGKSFKLIVMQSENVNSVFINTSSGSLKKIHSAKSNMDTGNAVIQDENGITVCSQKLTQVKCRGNSSFKYFLKKSYQIKLENKENLFGMGKAKTWLLIGNGRDRSQLRNYITAAMARYAGLEYTPEMVYADLYMNGEYRGLYLLTEKIQVSSSRVDIPDLGKATQAVNDKPLKQYARIGGKTSAEVKNRHGKYYDIPKDPEDITGGYLMEVERYWQPFSSTPTAFKLAGNMVVYMHTPKYLSAAQFTYIMGKMQAFEDAAFSDDGIDPKTGLHYSQIMDMESLVLKVTLEQVIKNYDANRTSQYFYKPADDVSTLIKAGPVWDYDAAWAGYGTTAQAPVLNPEGLFVVTGTSMPNSQWSSWYRALYKHTDFAQLIQECYRNVYAPALRILLGDEKDPTGQLRSINELHQMLTAAGKMDTARWTYRPIKNNRADAGREPESATQYLINWARMRMNWLDNEWNNQ